MTESRVALTFDTEHPDRPTRDGVIDEILAVLERTQVRGTFFLQGRWVSAYPETAREIAAGGHLVGNHSHSHVPMTHLTDAGLREDIETAGTIIRDATGLDPRPWFRCPFGAGMDDARVRRALEATGYRHVGWDVDVADWEVGRDGRSVAADVVTGVFDHRGDTVVLLHAWPVATGVALPGIIDTLNDRGVTFVGLDSFGDIPDGAGATPYHDIAASLVSAAHMTASILAVDGGNSKTDLALVGADGRLLAALRGPTTSHQQVGLADGTERLVGLVRELHAPGGSRPR